MNRLDMRAQVEAPIDPLWEVATRLDEKGLGSLGIQKLQSTPDRHRIEHGMHARLRLGMKIASFTIGGLVTVRIEEFDEELYRFGVNILDAPDGIRGNVGITMARSTGNPETHTDLRFHGDLKLPFKAALAFPVLRPALNSIVMPHVGGTLAKKAHQLGK